VAGHPLDQINEHDSSNLIIFLTCIPVLGLNALLFPVRPPPPLPASNSTTYSYLRPQCLWQYTKKIDDQVRQLQEERERSESSSAAAAADASTSLLEDYANKPEKIEEGWEGEKGKVVRFTK
jgi:hypothetical protein